MPAYLVAGKNSESQYFRRNSAVLKKEAPTYLLAGLKVLDITIAVAGPFGSRLLPDLGADVIKVERPAMEAGYGNGPHAGVFSPGYNMTNGSKRGVAIDLKQPEGPALLHALVPKVDVILENFAPGVIGRLGLDYETARTLNPKIVMCSLSVIRADRHPGAPSRCRHHCQAMSGIAAIIGEETDGPPLLANNTPCDTIAGTHAPLAILAAIYHRDRTGEGQHIDVSIIDAVMSMDPINLPFMAIEKEPAQIPRTGGHRRLHCHWSWRRGWRIAPGKTLPPDKSR